METRPFVPNAAAVAARREMEPFGPVQGAITEAPSPIDFVLAESAVRVIPTPLATNAPSAAYHPPPAFMSAPLIRREYTVRLSNLPTRLSNRDVSDLLIRRCGGVFMRCNLVFDKETRVSRGIAYVACATPEKASLVARKMRDHIIDNLQVCVEVLQDR